MRCDARWGNARPRYWQDCLTPPHQWALQDLKARDPVLYSKNGVLTMMERNMSIKRGPQRWQAHRWQPCAFSLPHHPPPPPPPSTHTHIYTASRQLRWRGSGNCTIVVAGLRTSKPNRQAPRLLCQQHRRQHDTSGLVWSEIYANQAAHDWQPRMPTPSCPADVQLIIDWLQGA